MQKRNICYDNNDIYQIAFDIISYMTLYDNSGERIDEVWKDFLHNTEQKNIDINTEDWYRYETLISKNKCL